MVTLSLPGSGQSSHSDGFPGLTGTVSGLATRPVSIPCCIQSQKQGHSLHGLQGHLWVFFWWPCWGNGQDLSSQARTQQPMASHPRPGSLWGLARLPCWATWARVEQAWPGLSLVNCSRPKKRERKTFSRVSLFLTCVFIEAHSAF